jgi:signal transduction histidine kinase
LARVRAALDTYRLRRMLEAQRRDHIAMLVHDLRHPLSSLGLIAEVLDSEDMAPEERHAAVLQIRGLCTEMARLVDGVLAASRLEAGVFAVEPRSVKVGNIIEPMLQVFTPVAARRRIALVFEGSLDLDLRADPQKLRQVLDNLVANALKFTPRGGRVVVRAFPEGQSMVFEIADTGPGIAASEQASIFDRYKQGSRGRAAGGAGLGLAIARGIAEAHHGTISVASGETGGATFRIVIPG